MPNVTSSNQYLKFGKFLILIAHVEQYLPFDHV